MLELLFFLALDQDLKRDVNFSLTHLDQFMDYLQKTDYRGYLAIAKGDKNARNRSLTFVYTGEVQVI